MPEQLLTNIIGFLIACLLGIIVYIFKGVKENLSNMTNEMSSLNAKLVGMATNQEWHYESIKQLQQDVKQLQDRHKGADL